MTKNNKLTVLLIFSALILISACTEPEAAEDRAYILSFNLSVPAGSTDVTVTVRNLETDIDISTAGPAVPPVTVPDISGTINYNDNELFRVIAVVTNLPANGTIAVEVWYEEVEDFPPDNSRRLIGTLTHTDETGAVTPTVTIYDDFPVPFPAGY